MRVLVQTDDGHTCWSAGGTASVAPSGESGKEQMEEVRHSLAEALSRSEQTQIEKAPVAEILSRNTDSANELVNR